MGGTEHRHVVARRFADFESRAVSAPAEIGDTFRRFATVPQVCLFAPRSSRLGACSVRGRNALTIVL